ncbi:DUF3800 domain-containing protein [Leifsonia sp. NPDC102414]|uniref:DUF3800 domain-containing protein n=1 Tax=Leifsonia sp. NPDC102414 TaxID=3364124 RepID=UPI0038191D41
MTGALSRLIYVDDSGDPNRGWIIYGWVECSPAEWRLALRKWLELRKELWRDYAIPPAQELHTTEYAQGRGRISTNPPARFMRDTTVLWKDLGREVARRCLETLLDCPHIRIGAVWEQTDLRGTEYYEERGRVYAELVKRWDDEHRAIGDFAFVSMDGDGSDPSYFNAHRALALDTRHIIEDPMFHDSKRSQWTQMADLVAYSAHAHVNAHPYNEFAWDWYRNYLSLLDPDREPQQLG